MLELVAAVMMVASQPSDICIAAAQRVMPFLIEEAKGTRHQAQIETAIRKAGSKDKAAVGVAAGLKPDQCAFLIVAPDSTIRALAISMLPERSGK
jgi:hypothetical protein